MLLRGDPTASFRKQLNMRIRFTGGAAMCPLKLVDIAIVAVLSTTAWLTYVVFKSPYVIKDCPMQHGLSHVRSEYKPDGSVICSYQEIAPARVVLRRGA
jgi:hypothetical protein